MLEKMNNVLVPELLDRISEIIVDARERVVQTINQVKFKPYILLIHIGVFIALLGGILGRPHLQRLKLTAFAGNPESHAVDSQKNVVELPFTIVLNRFTIDEYPPKLGLLENATGKTILKKTKHILIDNDFTSGKLLDWQITIEKHLENAVCVISDDSVNYVEYPSVGAVCALYVKALNLQTQQQQEGWVTCGSFLFPPRALRLDAQMSLFMHNREPQRYASEVTVFTKSGKTIHEIIEVNKPLKVDGWKIYQSDYDKNKGKWSRVAVLELVRDPWLPVVYIGIWMMIAGAVGIFLFTLKKKKISVWILIFSAIVALISICVHLFKHKTLLPALQSPWFLPHVTAYIIAYAVLGIATILAIYLLFFRKKERLIKTIEICDSLIYTGFAFYTLGMLFGALWAKEAWGHYWSWDPKETWAAATWLTYLAYIHFRLYRPNKPRTALAIILFAFLVLLVCWYGINWLPAGGRSVHSY